MRSLPPGALGLLLMPLLLSGCQSTSPMESIPATPAATPTPAPSSASPSPSAATSLSAPDGYPAAGSGWDVVAVRSDDSLVLRDRPGADGTELGRLPYDAAGLVATGESAEVGSAPWWQVRTELGQGWVNARYLTAQVGDSDFQQDPRVRARIDEFSALVLRGGDLTPVASRYGLTVHSFAPVVSFPHERLPTALRSTQQHPFGNPECGSEEGPPPPECWRTLAEVAETCAEGAGEPLATWAYDRPVVGSTGFHPRDYRPPAELVNHHYAAALINADGPWRACYFYFAYEQGRPVLAGFAFDAPGI